MFRRVLVANRGEISCRIQRTCHRLGIETVAVYSDADADAPHVRMATRSIRVGPPQVKDSYLNLDAVLDAARSTDSEAIHPGYGLLSERAAFAEAAQASGIVFVGPPVRALHAFGDKIQARGVARSVGVEPPPGSDGPIDPTDTTALTQLADRVGYPILVKAAGGGGGIGMQIVRDGAQLSKAAQTCSDRGKSAFADARVYLERYIDSPRHIEVQVLVDDHGNALALGERECSVQRRHQKIIEESPSPAAFFAGAEGANRRSALHASALKIVQAVGYRGAGTVEFVADQAGHIYFLEVNARLQVEHCVTEMCFGIDLVEEQLRIASGEPISEKTRGAHSHGHSVEARVYAENPDKKFVPQPGKLTELSWPEAASDLRIETGVDAGMDITPYYDPMIAKVVAWAPTRQAALDRLHDALGATRIGLMGAQGPATVNIEFLRMVLRASELRSGHYDTHLVDQLQKAKAL